MPLCRAGAGQGEGRQTAGAGGAEGADAPRGARAGICQALPTCCADATTLCQAELQGQSTLHTEHPTHVGDLDANVIGANCRREWQGAQQGTAVLSIRFWGARRHMDMAIHLELASCFRKEFNQAITASAGAHVRAPGRRSKRNGASTPEASRAANARQSPVSVVCRGKDGREAMGGQTGSDAARRGTGCCRPSTAAAGRVR